jgi:hypothetical protein
MVAFICVSVFLPMYKSIIIFIGTKCAIIELIRQAIFGKDYVEPLLTR